MVLLQCFGKGSILYCYTCAHTSIKIRSMLLKPIFSFPTCPAEWLKAYCWAVKEHSAPLGWNLNKTFCFESFPSAPQLFGMSTPQEHSRTSYNIDIRSYFSAYATWLTHLHIAVQYCSSEFKRVNFCVKCFSKEKVWWCI